MKNDIYNILPSDVHVLDAEEGNYNNHSQDSSCEDSADQAFHHQDVQLHQVRQQRQLQE